MSQPPRPSHLARPKPGPDDPELQQLLIEGLAQIQVEELSVIAGELASRRLELLESASRLREGQELSSAACWRLFRAVTCSRRHAQALSSTLDGEHWTPAAAELLALNAPVGQRIVRFVLRFPRLERRLALELATGLLHLWAPAQYWLWTRWLWDVRYQTGILPVLASSDRALRGGDLDTQYRQLRALIALGAEVGQQSGLLDPTLLDDPMLHPFAIDAFLAAAYSIYLYGITTWWLSREFNRLLPPLPQLTRRLLGLAPVASQRTG